MKGEKKWLKKKNFAIIAMGQGVLLVCLSVEVLISSFETTIGEKRQKEGMWGALKRQQKNREHGIRKRINKLD